MRVIKVWWGRVLPWIRLKPRSNGVPVRRATALHIGTGNVARVHQRWSDAASAYRRALAIEPHLQHLWVQLGHMEKEAGAIERATDAYENAAHLHPDDPEALLQLGHMAKAWRQPADAAGYFIRALQRDRHNLPAVSELVRLMPDRDAVDADLWSAALDVLDIDPASPMSDDTGHPSAGAMLFDVTDLLAFFGQRRLPTGIQRVQIEISLACLDMAFDIPPVFCIYASARRGWITLARDEFHRLCRLAKQSDDIEDPAWTQQLDRMYRRIAVSRTIRFAADMILVNLGTSWSDRNYLLDVRTIRARDGVVYVPLVFDLIPLIEPQWFMESLVRDYRAWFGSLLHSADGFLAISEATRRDLLKASAEWNAPATATSVPVVRLDGDFRQAAAGPAILRNHGLDPQGYVLFVSTLEPRKNHIGAFRAWLELADSVGESAMPRLVCVGGRGWLNDDLHRLLGDTPALRRMVLILHGIPDDVLAAFYEHCLFALYPSFYEGWGLPVSEALSYGKVPAISRTSSLPEAGGPYARYFDPHDPSDMAAVVRRLLDDRERIEAEDTIRQDYAPRTWRSIAQDAISCAGTVPSRITDTLPRLTDMDERVLALSGDGSEGPPAAQGEPFRHGRGWLLPDSKGCRIRGDDAALWFHWAGQKDRSLRLHFAASDTDVRVGIGRDGLFQEYRARAGEALAIDCPLPATDGPIRLAIVPIAGEVTIERIVVTPATRR